MALLDNILKKIKGATLDRTDLDEKIGAGVKNFVQNVVQPNIGRLRNIDPASTFTGGAIKSYREALQSRDPKQLMGYATNPLYSTIRGGVRNMLAPKPTFLSEEVEKVIPGTAGKAIGLAGEIALPGVGGDIRKGTSLLRTVARTALKSAPIGAAYSAAESKTPQDILPNALKGALMAGGFAGVTQSAPSVMGAIGRRINPEQTAKAFRIQKALRGLDVYDKMAPEVQMKTIGDFDNAVKEFLPKLLDSKQYKEMDKADQLKLAKRYLEEELGQLDTGQMYFAGKNQTATTPDTTPAKIVQPSASGEATEAKIPPTQTAKSLWQRLRGKATTAEPGVSPTAQVPAKLDNLLSVPKSQSPAGQLDEIMSKQANRMSPSDEIIQQARGEIGSMPSKGDKPLGQQLRDFYTNWVNRFQPLEDVATKIEKETKSSILPEKNPVYTVKRLLGAGGVAEQRHQKVLQPILDELGDVPSTDFDVFLKAKRDLNLGARGIKGSDAVKAQGVIDALGQKYDLGKMDGVAQKLYVYQDEGLRALRDGGIIGNDVYAKIRNTSQNYVPFQRVMDEVDNYLGLPTKKAYVGSQPVQKIKGSERQILSPVESIIANTYKIESAVSRNRVAQSLVNLRNIAPQYNNIFEPVAKDAADAMAVWEGGKKVYYRVGEDIARAVKGLNEENVGILTKILSAPAQLLRQGATGRNIDFMIPNVFKDQFDAAISSKYGYVPFVDYFRGLGHLLNYKKTGGDQIVEEWINSGGKIFFENMGGRKQISEQIADATQPKGILKQLGQWALGGLDTIGELSETPTRIGLYMRAKEKTGNSLISAMESREGTLDFARMGAKMKTANAIIPFLNVGVQGFDKLIRNVRDNPGKMALNMTLFAGMPQLAISLYNNLFHPNEYAKVPQWEKDTNFILITGTSAEGIPQYLKIPKGNIVPFIANPTDQLVSYLAGTDKQSFGQMALGVLSEGLPLVGSGTSISQIAARTIGSNLPQAFKPLVENVMNKSTFYTDEQGNAQDIVPYYLEKKAAPLQFKKSTPEAYKALGKILNVSPLKAQNFLEGYLSGFIKTPVNISQILKSVSEGQGVDPNKVPLLRRFYGEREEYGSAAAPAKTEGRFAASAAEPNMLQRLFGQKTTDQTGGVNDKRIKAADDTFKLTDLKAMPESSAYEKALKRTKAFAQVDNIMDSEDFTDNEKISIVESLGISGDEAEYYNVARQVESAKTAYVQEALAKAGEGDTDTLLTEMRREVNGKMVLSNGVIDDLADAGTITTAQAKALKKLKYNKTTGKVSSSATGGSGTKALKSLVAVFKAMREDNAKLLKSTQSTKKLPTALSLVMKQRKTKKASSSSLDRILSQKRTQSRKPIDIVRGLAVQ